MRPVPTNTLTKKDDVFQQENFQDLDKEYSFSTKALTRVYLKRKMNKWLYENGSVNQSKLLRELLYAKYKHPALLCEVVSESPRMFNDINMTQSVSDYKALDIPFSDFIDGLKNCTGKGEFLVNTFTANKQSEPAIAMDASGNYIVVWQSNSQASTRFLVQGMGIKAALPNSFFDIYAQRYFANGAKNGSEFLVNSYTYNKQKKPSVAMDDSGDFVIAWQSSNQPNDNYYGIYGQRYNSTGTPQ